MKSTERTGDIRAKGTRSWSRFRLDLMKEAAESLIVGPAKAINPRVKVVIKYPTWSEHFPYAGFDLEREPLLFDGIYAGTETRDPVLTHQHLQGYQSYSIVRYFENIKPGGNGGGWVDPFARITLDRPGKLNAINDEMPRELRDAVARAGDDDGVHVIVLAGAGRAFWRRL